MSSEDDPPLEVLLACFEGRKRAAKVHHPLSKQIKAEGAEILDEAVLTVTPKGKARVYDPRRVVAGTLTPALTWGAFTLLGGGKGWSLVIWVVIGAVCGGLYAYYYEHLANKNELARLGKLAARDHRPAVAGERVDIRGIALQDLRIESSRTLMVPGLQRLLGHG